MSETASMPSQPENVHLAENRSLPQRIVDNKAGRLVVGALAVVGLGAAFYGVGEAYHASKDALAGSASGTSGTIPKISGKLDPNCLNPSLTPQTYPGHINEVLPASDLASVNNVDKAATYVQSLFSKGSLGTKLDPGAEAIVWSVTGSPANSNGVSAENDVIGTAATAYSQMTSSNAKNNIKAAEAYCQQDLNTMALTFGYSDTAIAKGTKYTRLDPSLNGGNNITGIKKLDQITATNDEAGITFIVKNPNGNTANGGQLNGFYEVVIPTHGNGEVDVLGGLPVSSNAKNKTNNAKSSAGPSKGQSNTNKLGTTGGGGVTAGGNIHESQPGTGQGTVSQGNGTGQIGGSPESGTPGNHPTPSGGGGSPTTIETAPPTPTTLPPTPTTLPPTPTTLPPTPTTLPPTPTTLPPYKPPVGCDVINPC